jgi:hypothetical protein
MAGRKTSNVRYCDVEIEEDFTVNKLVFRRVGHIRANPVSYLHLARPETPWCYPILSFGTSITFRALKLYEILFTILLYHLASSCNDRARVHVHVRMCMSEINLQG